MCGLLGGGLELKVEVSHLTTVTVSVTEISVSTGGVGFIPAVQAIVSSSAVAVSALAIGIKMLSFG